jgi:hypothetical protein
MPSIIGTEPIEGRFIDYIEETFLPDAFLGLLAWVLIVPVALLLGGFMFIEPWCIVTTPVMFAFGVSRGKSDGNGLLKGVAMNLAVLLFLIARMMRNPFQLKELNTLLLAAFVTVVPTVLGITFRRRLLNRTKWSRSQR